LGLFTELAALDSSARGEQEDCNAIARAWQHTLNKATYYYYYFSRDSDVFKTNIVSLGHIL
jgi:hypothetical protein